MRLWLLFLRTRLVGHALLAFPPIAALGWWWANHYRHDPGALIVPLVLCPLAVACVVGVGSHSPFGEAEETASRSLPILRLGHLSGLILIGIGVLAVASLSWVREDAEMVLARNLVGFAGIALLGARFLGGRLSWALAVAYGLTAYLTPGLAKDGAWWEPRWGWPKQPADEANGIVVALLLLAVGLLVVARWGARQAPGEAA